MADARCPSCGKTLPAGVPMGLCPECLIKAGFHTGAAPGAPGAARRAPPPALDDLRPFFPQLEILELIGRGGMGAVYKARQPSLDRLVALKILLPAGGGSTGFAERFTREARALARLQHPRIVTVHDVGVAGTLHYLIMEFVDGRDLRQVQRSGRLTPAQALTIVPEICEALQFAHDRGIVHRDIKPENVLLDRDGHVKITDFGIAKILGTDPGETVLTGTVDVMGTPHYMAPEQIETPAGVDHRADIYSLGVVFYELLTGELPLGRFQAPSSRVRLDVRLDEVVLRALEKEPDRRYQQASEVKQQVDSIAGSAPAVPPRGILRHRPITALPAMLLYALQVVFLAYAEIVLVQAGWTWIDAPVDDEWAWTGALPWLGLHAVLLVLAYLAWGVLHHACWTALPERYRDTTPARAVGFLFIPVFNLYWAFVTLGRLAEGFNAWRDDHPGQPIRNASTLATLKALSFGAFWTIAWVPGLASIVCVPDAVLFVLYYRAIVANANLVIAHETPGAGPATSDRGRSPRAATQPS